jgi:hypothetical protein
MCQPLVLLEGGAGRLEGVPGARVRAIVSDAKGKGKGKNECELNENACPVANALYELFKFTSG